MLLLAFGILGYLLRRFDYPIAPVVVGLILGPMAEQQLRRALAISQGDPIVLFHSPIAITLYVLAAAAVLVPLWFRLRGKGRRIEPAGQRRRLAAEICGRRQDRKPGCPFKGIRAFSHSIDHSAQRGGRSASPGRL
ncbi:hypothetical protein [Devosia ginsengisoli]|uniref:hypothetical protein n=1 Tax=Devosia ginsengisoli TaxID=400770 RepID=UPI001FE45091|nr:hypothetical protein [Devosia ginsengisoli]